jgi:hypothetical protein
MINVYLKVNKSLLFYINTTLQKRMGDAGTYILCYRRRHQTYLKISLIFPSCSTSRYYKVERDSRWYGYDSKKRETCRKSFRFPAVLTNQVQSFKVTISLLYEKNVLRWTCIAQYQRLKKLRNFVFWTA